MRDYLMFMSRWMSIMRTTTADSADMKMPIHAHFCELLGELLQ